MATNIIVGVTGDPETRRETAATIASDHATAPASQAGRKMPNGGTCSCLAPSRRGVIEAQVGSLCDHGVGLGRIRP